MDDKAVAKQLESLYRDRESALTFPEPFESEFRGYYNEKFASHIRSAMIVGGFMFFLNAVIQLFFEPVIRHELLFSYSILAPLILSFIVLAQIKRLHPYYQILAFCSAATLSIGLMYMGYRMPETSRDLVGYGIMLILIYALCFSRILFRPAMLFTALNMIAINGFLFLGNTTSVYVYLSENFIFICGSVLLLTNNFIMEYADRQEFLQSRLMEYEKNRTEQLNDYLNVIANQDPMTGLANFRHFETVFEREWSHASRHQYPLAILMIDFDHFKSLNDTYGHQAGDEALQKIGKCLHEYGRRAGDLAARYGGDEFVLLLSGTPGEAAANIAENLRIAIEAMQIPNINSTTKPIVTTTIGVAAMIPLRADAPEDLVKMADESLFVAKEQGRNCVGFEGRVFVGSNHVMEKSA